MGASPMAIHTFKKSQIIPASLAQCWNFFSDPHNLSQITPASLDFTVLSELPDAVYPGMMIEYRVRPLFGIPVRWLTEITHVEPMTRFVDEQRSGPYRLWHHEHTFTQLDNNRILARDLITYILPFGWLVDLADPLMVRRQLNMIFDYRTKAVARIFGGDCHK